MHTALKNVELLKHIKIKEVAPTCFSLQGNHHQGATASKGGYSNMFRFTKKPSSGSHNQYLAKITHSDQCGYMEVVQDIVSVMAA